MLSFLLIRYRSVGNRVYNFKPRIQTENMKLKSRQKLAIFPIFAFLLVAGLSSCKSSKNIAVADPIEEEEKYAFDFVTSGDLQDVLDRARNEDKLIFVDVYADWCLPCKMMDRDVFSHEETARIFNKNFINYKVNSEEEYGLKLAFDYRVDVLPTLLFLDQNGKELVRQTGAVYHRELLELAQLAMGRSASDK